MRAGASLPALAPFRNRARADGRLAARERAVVTLSRVGRKRAEMAGFAARRLGEGGVAASYYASRLRGLHCSTLVDAGPPRALVHDRFVLFLLTAGASRVWCRGETYALAPGSVLLLSPGDVQRDVEKTPYSAVVVTLGAELVATLRRQSVAGASEPVVVGCEKVHRAAAALVEAVRNREALAEQERSVGRLATALAPFWSRSGVRREPALVVRARRMLTDPRGAPWSLGELAARLGCAPTYLCRMFSEYAGVGPHAYQLQQRLLDAGRLLESGRTVAMASALTGFSDDSHFRRHFRRRFATAPSRYQTELAAGVNS